MNSLLPAMLSSALVALLFSVALPTWPSQEDPAPADEPSGTAQDPPRDRGPARWRDDSNPPQRALWDQLEGKPAPELKPLDGFLNTEARTWKELHGKVVLIHYWATWAEPAVDSLVRMQELHRRYSQDGLVVLGVHALRGWRKMQAFAEKRRLPYALAADPKGLLGAALGIQIVPTCYVVDRGGQMRVAGARDKELEDIVQALLLEPTPEYVEPAPPVYEWPPHVEKDLYGKDFRGQPAPEFVVEQWLTDEPETEGKVVLIDLWATWCPPCREAIPELDQLQKKFAKNLVVIGLSDEPPETVQSFMKQVRMEYPQAIDQQGRMKQALEVKGIPHVLILSRDGIVRWQGFPMSPEDRLTEALVEQIVRADQAKLGKPDDAGTE